MPAYLRREAPAIRQMLTDPSETASTETLQQQQTTATAAAAAAAAIYIYIYLTACRPRKTKKTNK